ncbi:unnamed protein product [Ectocarpus sp. 8 AP-2014]
MNPDTLSHVLSYCDNAYLYVATVSKTWRHAYGQRQNTSVHQAVASVSRVASILPTLKLNVPMNNAAFYHASKNGNVCVLDRLLANERPVALYACTAGAVAGGHLRALEWAFSNGFVLDSFVCHSAASTGNLQMLEWAVDKGCPWDPAQCRDASRQNGHFAVQQWIGSFLADYATK